MYYTLSILGKIQSTDVPRPRNYYFRYWVFHSQHIIYFRYWIFDSQCTIHLPNLGNIPSIDVPRSRITVSDIGSLTPNILYNFPNSEKHCLQMSQDMKNYFGYWIFHSQRITQLPNLGKISSIDVPRSGITISDIGFLIPNVLYTFPTLGKNQLQKSQDVELLFQIILLAL